MNDNDNNAQTRPIPKGNDEGGLHAPPGLGFWRTAWWWFDFVILVNLARFRFIAVLVVIGLVILKWDLLTAYYEKWTRPDAQEHAHGEFEYYCPMHPTVIRDNPKDKCPICFMPLSKRRIGANKEEALPPGIVNRVQLSPYRVVLAGIETTKLSYLPLTKEITTVGFVEFDESEMKQVSARVKGRLDKLFVDQTGQYVQANQELASLYSPELVVTVHELLDAAKPGGNPSLVKSARERLHLWGISDDQIEELLKTGKANTHLIIRSPIKGHVLKKYVKEGQYVEEGSPLYDIADLATVWIEGQVYENDLAFLPPQAQFHKDGSHLNLTATAFTRANPTEKLEGKVTFIHPHVDPGTRTVVVRTEFANPGHKLRPGTSATVNLTITPKHMELFSKTFADDWLRDSTAQTTLQSLDGPWRGATFDPMVKFALRKILADQGRLLAVPETAVIDTGNRTIVYRETAPNEYEGVQVELGPRMQGRGESTYYPVLDGLRAGDVIVTSGSFLLDAETRLNPAAGSIYFGGSSSVRIGAASTVRPSTPADVEAKIAANLDKLSAADRALADAQVYCPVWKDNPLGSMGVPIKLMIHNQPVFLCCTGCKNGALANPQKTLDTVAKLKAKHQAK